MFAVISAQDCIPNTIIISFQLLIVAQIMSYLILIKSHRFWRTSLERTGFFMPQSLDKCAWSRPVGPRGAGVNVILYVVRFSVPVRDGMLAFLEMPEQNIWYALLVVGIMLLAYKKPHKR